MILNVQLLDYLLPITDEPDKEEEDRGPLIVEEDIAIDPEEVSERKKSFLIFSLFFFGGEIKGKQDSVLFHFALFSFKREKTRRKLSPPLFCIFFF